MSRVLGYSYIPATHLKVTDEDAADFLQSQFSNDLRPFEDGQCVYGLWLDVKGKVIADSWILCEEKTRFLVLSEYSPATEIIKKLEDHIIADDVMIDQMPPGGAIALFGDDVVASLTLLGFQAPPDTGFVRVDDLYVFPGRRSLAPGFELWSNSASTMAELKKRLVEMGVDFIATEEMQQMRIAAGIPSVPGEIGPADLPGEGAMVGKGVSLTKGCYLGQEVVARMHNVGRAQRALFRMTGSGTAPQCPVPLYNSELKNIGELRSAYVSESGWSGVALLKVRYAKPGELLKYDSGDARIDSYFTTINDTTE